MGLYQMSKACFDMKVYDEASLHASVAIAIMTKLDECSPLFSFPGFAGLTIPISLHALRGNSTYEMFIQNDCFDNITKRECLEDILDDYKQCMLFLEATGDELLYAKRTKRFTKRGGALRD